MVFIYFISYLCLWWRFGIFVFWFFFVVCWRVFEVLFFFFDRLLCDCCYGDYFLVCDIFLAWFFFWEDLENCCLNYIFLIFRFVSVLFLVFLSDMVKFVCWVLFVGMLRFWYCRFGEMVFLCDFFVFFYENFFYYVFV